MGWIRNSDLHRRSVGGLHPGDRWFPKRVERAHHWLARWRLLLQWLAAGGGRLRAGPDRRQDPGPLLGGSSPTHGNFFSRPRAVPEPGALLAQCARRPTPRVLAPGRGRGIAGGGHVGLRQHGRDLGWRDPQRWRRDYGRRRSREIRRVHRSDHRSQRSVAQLRQSDDDGGLGLPLDTAGGLHQCDRQGYLQRVPPRHRHRGDPQGINPGEQRLAEQLHRQLPTGSSSTSARAEPVASPGVYVRRGGGPGDDARRRGPGLPERADKQRQSTDGVQHRQRHQQRSRAGPRHRRDWLLQRPAGRGRRVWDSSDCRTAAVALRVQRARGSRTGHRPAVQQPRSEDSHRPHQRDDDQLPAHPSYRSGSADWGECDGRRQRSGHGELDASSFEWRSAHLRLHGHVIAWRFRRKRRRRRQQCHVQWVGDRHDLHVRRDCDQHRRDRARIVNIGRHNRRNGPCHGPRGADHDDQPSDDEPDPLLAGHHHPRVHCESVCPHQRQCESRQRASNCDLESRFSR